MNRFAGGFLFFVLLSVTAEFEKTASAESPQKYYDMARVAPQEKREKIASYEVPTQSLISDPRNSSYRLGPEDLLKISVWKDESLTAEVLVRPDGNISFPLVGEVAAAGKSVDEVREEISQKIAPFIPDPTVSVLVLKINSYKVYVVGKVNRPGEYLVGHYPDVMQALSLAGGLTPYASENSIKVLRRENGKEVSFLFQYGDVKKGKELEQNLILKPGDVVVVP